MHSNVADEVSPMIQALGRVFCVGIVLGVLSCDSRSVPPRSRATVSFNWSAWTAAKPDDSSYLSVEGPLFTTKEGGPPGAGVQAVIREINGKRYRGIVVAESTDRDSPIMEVFIRGEANRVFLRTNSKVAFAVRIDNHSGTRLTWILSGERKAGAIDLPAGEYQIEIVGTADSSEQSRSVSRPSSTRPG